MLTFPPSVRIFVATAATDLRKGFDGLSGLAATLVAEDPKSGHLFVFFNRRGGQVRILYWDRTGWCIFAKRLARGTFRIDRVVPEGATSVSMDSAELALVLEGIDLTGARRRARWQFPPNT